MCNKHLHSTVTHSSRFHCLIGVINKPTTVELCTYHLGLPEATHPKEDTEDQKGGQSFTKEDKKEDASLTLNSPFGFRSSSSNQTKLANCKLRNKTVTGKSRENQVLQCS